MFHRTSRHLQLRNLFLQIFQNIPKEKQNIDGIIIIIIISSSSNSSSSTPTTTITIRK